MNDTMPNLLNGKECAPVMELDIHRKRCNMKCALCLMVATLLTMGGCYYAPLTEEHTIPIDPAVLGLWEELPHGAKMSDPPDESRGRILILKYSPTEYLVYNFCPEEGLYFRAYPINIESVDCVQLELIGTSAGVVEEDRKYYVVASYVLSNGQLEVRMLNGDIVDMNLRDSASLRQVFRENKANERLFVPMNIEPIKVIYRRIEPAKSEQKGEVAPDTEHQAIIRKESQ